MATGRSAEVPCGNQQDAPAIDGTSARREAERDQQSNEGIHA